jgi:hypothetical protein
VSAGPGCLPAPIDCPKVDSTTWGEPRGLMDCRHNKALQNVAIVEIFQFTAIYSDKVMQS